jgi:hypothetical protein
MEQHNVQNCIDVVHSWARSKLNTGKEPPWSWYQYMKLIEAIQAIRKGRSATARSTDDHGLPDPDLPM